MTSAGIDGNWLTEDAATQSGSPLGNRLMFTARDWDSSTELYYYRFRDYSPILGRFLQPDPAKYIDGMNLYAYCGNNSINWIDPWGLWTVGAGASGQASFGWGVTFEAGFVYSPSTGWTGYVSYGVGAGTPSAGVGVAFTGTSAGSANGLGGLGGQSGGGFGPVTVDGVYGLTNPNYGGGQLTLGFSTPIPETHTFGTNTNVWQKDPPHPPADPSSLTEPEPLPEPEPSVPTRSTST